LALLPEPHGRGLGHAPAISGPEASMRNDSTVYVGLDVHKESITVAYAVDGGEVESLGRIGTTKTEIDRLCERLRSKARHVRVVYEAGPCGYGLYRQLVQKGFDCMVCAPSLIRESQASA
jgi:transposase